MLLALEYYVSISREEQPYALGVFHDITFLGDTTRVLLALKYYVLISREEQPYALGVFHHVTF